MLNMLLYKASYESVGVIPVRFKLPALRLFMLSWIHSSP